MVVADVADAADAADADTVRRDEADTEIVIAGAEAETTNMSICALLVRTSFITTTVILDAEVIASKGTIQFVTSSAEDAWDTMLKVGSIMHGRCTAEREVAEQFQINCKPAAAPAIPAGKSGSELCDASAENTSPTRTDCNDPPQIVANRSDCTTDMATDAEAELLEPVSVTVSRMI